MSSNIVCNVTSHETRVAVLENGAIVELFIERKSEQGIVGSIYKGKVTKVLPGMQVAFVDIGLPRAGFLYVSDVNPSGRSLSGYIEAGAGVEENGDEVELDQETHRPDSLAIEEILSEGDEIMAQVSKDPMGSKGARITGYITLPGRYLVYMPTVSQVGVSRRIENEAERKRLRDIVRRLKKNGAGYIVRTAAEGVGEADLESDIEFLDKLWAAISERYESARAPSPIYQDLTIIQRVIRDIFSRDFESVVIDDEEEHGRTAAFCRSYLPELESKVRRYTGKEPLFDVYGLELEIERALERKVWLKSGGYIVIDQTEALTAVDVNTGRFVGKTDQEETILKTNLEAVREIVYQLRLRNIGGLIIIDFIDMERDESKEKVYSALAQALKGDRSRSNILKISELGLVEMTRKRVRDSLSRSLTTLCPYCEGRGAVKSSATVLCEVYREIQRVAAKLAGGERDIRVMVPPGVAGLMFEEEPGHLDRLETELGVRISVNTDYTLHQERFEVSPG